MLDRSIMEKLVGQDPIWVMFSQVTRHPFIYSSPVNEANQIFVFTQEERLEDKAQAFLDMMYQVTKVCISPARKRQFFMELPILGIEEIVFEYEDGKYTSPLKGILDHPDLTRISGWDPLPDYRSMPEDRRPLTNPMLQASAMFFAQELNRDVSPEEKKIGISYCTQALEANLGASTFIMPLMPDEAAKGKAMHALNIDQIGVVVVKDNAGGQWLPIFSDDMEFAQFNNENKLIGTTGKLEDLIKRLPKDGKGAILNPNSICMQLPMQLIKHVIEKAKSTPTA